MQLGRADEQLVLIVLLIDVLCCTSSVLNCDGALVLQSQWRVCHKGVLGPVHRIYIGQAGLKCISSQHHFVRQEEHLCSKQVTGHGVEKFFL